MVLLKKILFGILLFFLSGCASNFIVKSDPSEADVYVKTTGRDEEISLGKTPLSLPLEELQQKVRIDSASGEYFDLIVKKKDYQTKTLAVPASRMGHRETLVAVKLKQGQDDSKTVSLLLQHLFNAQKLANERSFEKAQSEIDKALAIDPTFSRAMSLRGSIFFVQKQYKEALTWFGKALDADPQFEDAIKMITYIKKITGDDTSRTPAEVK